ncbi:hypothetical protein A9Q89_04175 [Gammaproteobacteria bacterium 53_120_T64]|nr:hypothetical protein A9Q89_04175 [Gammaproteobacteria bacterium 53_120_T64]
MSAELYLQTLGLAGLLYFMVFLCSIYVWRISSLRLVWLGVGGATLLSAILRLVTLFDMRSQEFLRESYSWLSLLDVSIPILLLAGAGFALPVIKTYNRRLELAEDSQQALLESEEKYRELIESTGAGYVILDDQANVLECNETYVSLIGRNGFDEVIGHNLTEWVDETKKGDFVIAEMANHFGGELRTYDGLTYLDPHGRPIPLEIYSRGRQTKEGLRIIGLVRDVSQREAVRKQLEASERQSNLLFENAPISTAIFAPNGQFLRANKAHDELWGVVLSEVAPDFNILQDPQTNHLIGKETLAAIFEGERMELEPFIYRASEFVPQSGYDNTILPMFFPLLDDEGVVESIVQMHIDLTERVAAEQKIRESEGFYRALIESTNDGYALLKPDETVIDANAEYIRLTGHSELSDIKGQVSRQWVSGDMGLAELGHLLEVGGNASGVRCDYRHSDGTLIPAEVSATLVESSTGPQVVVLARDISERLESEGRLRQAQKMDAIGKLTGGVAHDFNNLLGVILGNTELALGNQAAQAAVGPYLDAILDATERGADLTHRLLAFSRQTPLAPKVLDINVALENAGALLQRLIGEDVDLMLVTSQAIPNCEVDPGELENVIINLANNARDAMPRGGKLVIEANSMICEPHNKMVSGGELKAGNYVVVSVSDSGTGIDADILHRVTDPFFTTKDVGKGTGLGLSMAYGFAKQSNGHLSIYSEMGEGTTVNIFIPAHSAEAESIASRAPSIIPKGNEKILLVEDDPALATMACHMLEVLGYRVEVADTVDRAIEMYRQQADFDLLLSDMILPGGRNGRNGRQLADELQAITPALKVMYMSGYTENAILHHGRLDAGVVLLQKPFRTSDLSILVRQVLDS